MRAFFCIELASNLRDELSKITSRLKRTDARVSWVKAENLHITVKFLGDVTDDVAPKLEAAARTAIQSSQTTSPISCTFNLLGAFPNSNRPPMLVTHRK